MQPLAVSYFIIHEHGVLVFLFVPMKVLPEPSERQQLTTPCSSCIYKLNCCESGVGGKRIDVDMARLITLLIMVVLSSSLKAQSFTSCMNNAETRISKLKEAEKLVTSSIQNTEAIKAVAQQTANPQQYIDFVVLRYERNNRKIQLAIVQATNDAIKKLSAFIGKSDIDQVTLKEGITKYSDMSALAHKFANELQEKLFDHLSAYLNNYGYDFESIFRQDNMDLLLEYEVY